MCTLNQKSFRHLANRGAFVGVVMLVLVLAVGCGAGPSFTPLPVLPPPPPGPTPVTVTVNPDKFNVPLLGTQQFTATVTGTSNTTVIWSISGTGCSSANPATCGTIDATGLYTAPWCVATTADAPVTRRGPDTLTVTATSVADSTKSGSAIVTNVVPFMPVDGRYAFLFQGTDSDGLMAAAGTFVADANGHITSGIEDISLLSGTNTEVTFTGTYNIPCYHRGTMTFILDTNPGAPKVSLPPTQTFAFGLEAGGDEARFIELDNTGIRGSGVAKKQDPTAFGTSGFVGDFAFGFAGSIPGVYPPGPDRIGEIGRFNADGGGNISAGLVDLNDGGSVTARTPIGGTYAIDATTGRGTAIWGITQTSPVPGRAAPSPGVTNGADFFSFYVVSASESFWISSSGVLAGQVLQQTGGPFDDTSLNFPAVFSLTGKNPANQNADVAIGILRPDAAGGLVGGPMDENFDATLSTYSSLTGTYHVDNDGAGRGTMHIDMANCAPSGSRLTNCGPAGASRDMTFYMVSPNTAFLMDGNGTLKENGIGALKGNRPAVTGPNVGVGLLEPQTGGPFDLASLKGEFYLGSSGMATQYVPVECGVAMVDGAGHVTGMGDASDIFGSYSDMLIVNGGYTIEASGRGTVPTFAPAYLVLYVVSPNKALMFEMDNTQHQPAIIVMEQADVRTTKSVRH